ncbi:MAG: hypothetical protein QXM43_05425 [Desulfurococcaceae archaeon]
MKFSEIIEPSGGYVNTSHDYFLVLGIYDRGYPTPTGTGNFENRNGVLTDPNGNTVDVFYDIVVQVSQWTNNMTVWNGTSMETEPYTQNTTQVFILEKKEMLVPPSYRLSGFGYAIGFWLTFDEVQEYILKGNKSVSEKLQNWGNIEVISE